MILLGKIDCLRASYDLHDSAVSPTIADGYFEGVGPPLLTTLNPSCLRGHPHLAGY